jgi:L-threonylcarbamoyladenylate synthase
MQTNLTVYLFSIDIKCHPNKPGILEFQSDINFCLEVLQNGGLILYPTDTIWGIGCDATNPIAVEKIYALKKRPGKKSLIVLLADKRDVLKYSTQPHLNIFAYLQTVTVPTTVIYEGAIGLAENIINEDGTAAMRVVNERFCKQLIKRFRKPIVSTSANISGEPYPRFFNEISGKIKNGVNYVVQYGQDDTRIKEPSSVVKWDIDGTMKVIRP